ncbi:hypothetical protein LY78DRAFT_695830 [Colletotrichum sublineola]|nr:hypothetical protein LY78DRAFT_695830 [Colletotrichum sublineola]
MAVWRRTAGTRCSWRTDDGSFQCCRRRCCHSYSTTLSWRSQDNSNMALPRSSNRRRRESEWAENVAHDHIDGPMKKSWGTHRTIKSRRVYQAFLALLGLLGSLSTRSRRHHSPIVVPSIVLQPLPGVAWLACNATTTTTVFVVALAPCRGEWMCGSG